MKTSSEKISARVARIAKPRERNVRAELDKRVAEYNGVTRAVAWLGRAGAPDVLCLFGPTLRPRLVIPDIRHVVWVETKTTGGELTKHQIEEHALLRYMGQKVLVITTMAELDAWLPPR